MSTYTSQIQIAKNTTYGALALVADKEQTNNGAFPFGEDELEHTIDLYARARHKGPYGTSAWSSSVHFRIAPPANIIGVCQYGSGGRIGDFRRIDGAGNFLSSFDYRSHPIYTNCMRDVIIDGCRMKEFDTLYVKTAYSGPSTSDSAGKPCWWISDVPYPYFHPMATFLRGGITKEKIWIGTYLGHQEVVRDLPCIGSLPDKTVQTNCTKTTFKQYINNRNDAGIGINGFRPFDIWDASLLRLLLLVFGGSDTQLVWGDNKEGTKMPSTGSTGATALGIHDLWRCYWYHTYLISQSSSTILLTDPYTEETITTGLSFPTTEGWITDIHRGEHLLGGTPRDYMEYFLPKSVSTAESNGTFADYYRPVGTLGVGMGHAVQDGGTKQVNYWKQYQKQCPHYTYVPAQSRYSYWDRYKEQCGYRKSNGFVLVADGTYLEHTPTAPTGCTHFGGWYSCKVVSTGHSATCSRANTTTYLDSVAVCDTSASNTDKIMISQTYTKCPVCGRMVYDSYPLGKYQARCSVTPKSCGVPHTSVVTTFNCTWYGANTVSKCYNANCEHWYQGSSPATTKCGKTGGVCLEQGCAQTYTVDAVSAYTSECGIFSYGPAEVDGYTAVRIAKS